MSEGVRGSPRGSRWWWIGQACSGSLTRLTTGELGFGVGRRWYRRSWGFSSSSTRAGSSREVSSFPSITSTTSWPARMKGRRGAGDDRRQVLAAVEKKGRRGG